MNTIRDRLSEKAARNRVPIMCAFELLPVCNLSCRMCYVRKSMSEVRQAGGLKNAEWWLNLARQGRELGLLYPLLTGGEPFLHPDFRKIMSGMLDMGLQVSINSNGTLIDRDWAAWLGDHRPVRINMTLYGASSETYGRLCGNPDAFQRVLEAVSLLKEYGVAVKFNASITPENVQDLDGIIAYAKEQECPVQIATYMFPPIRRDSTMVGQNDRLTPEEAALARVRADFLQAEPEWFAGQARRFSHFVPLDALDQYRQPSGPMHMRCRAGLCSFWIDWQGNLTNCGMYGSAHAAMEGRSFREAWQELVERTEQVAYAPFCSGCPNQALCHPCVAMVNNECGDLNGKPEYLCRMNAESARLYQEYAKRLPDSATADATADVPRQDDLCMP